jgi:hypothetical protein
MEAKKNISNYLVLCGQCASLSSLLLPLAVPARYYRTRWYSIYFQTSNKIYHHGSAVRGNTVGGKDLPSIPLLVAQKYIPAAGSFTFFFKNVTN